MSGKYGEPWVLAARTQRSIFIDNANGISVASVAQLLFDDAENTRTAERFVACVNALDGKNPPALSALVEASRRLSAYINDCHAHSTPLSPGELVNLNRDVNVAMAEFDGGGE